MTFEINKEIQTPLLTFKIGDVITTYNNYHYFNVTTTDIHNQKVITPLVFGATIGKDGKIEVKQKDLQMAKTECSQFINKYFFKNINKDGIHN